MNSYYLYGAGGHGKSVCDILLSSVPAAQICFLDDNPGAQSVLGFPVKPGNSEVAKNSLIICLGNIESRKNVFIRFEEDYFINVISKSAHIGRQTKIGTGIFIGNFVHVGPAAEIGSNSILNNGCVIEHDVKVGKHVNIGPGTIVSGSVTIEDECDVGAGVVIKNNIRICYGCVIGAGSVVVEDISVTGTYAGVPAKRLK